MRVMVAGPVSCGKTTLCQRLAGLPLVSQKTQTIIQIGAAIDTPGEYLEGRWYWNRLISSSSEAGLMLLALDCGNRHYQLMAGLASMFNCPVAGLVTKADIGGAEEVEFVRKRLVLAGATPVFAVSALTGQGFETLTGYLETR
ncbi:MAG: EutP/PduV family microcompartment system protein [Spirochaetaceae bacterium]|jgi:ethanolamine utilization protein EutP|nr:EutP/PduV family microcompartment system protein [Spirochaetaceae bacterium]